MIRRYFSPQHQTKKPLKSRGFTIVELLVIVAVIGILAGITIVSYSAVTQNAKKETVKTDAVAVAAQLKKYKADKGAFPDQNTFLTLDKKGTGSTYEYTYDSVAGTYCLTASVKGASVYVVSGNSLAKEGGCPGHGVDGELAVTNYSPTPSYEASGGWYSNNGPIWPTAADTTIKRSGARALKSYGVNAGITLLTVYAAGGADGYGVASPSKASGTYSHSVYFRADVAHKGRLAVAWRVGGAWSATQYGQYTTGTPGQWSRATQEFTIPANVEYIRSVAYVEGLTSQPANTPAWIDDYMLVDGSDMPPYADGNSPNWLWKGTQNASVSYGPRLK